MLGEKVLLGNVRLPLDLGSVCARFGYDTKDPVIDKMMKAGVCPSEMPQKRLLARCVRDVRTTSALMRDMLYMLDERDALHIYRNRCDFGDVLSHMESGMGMLLDESRVRDEYAAYSEKLAKVQTKLDDMTGGINLRSREQLAKFLYEDLKFPEKCDRRGKPLRNAAKKGWPDGVPKTDQLTLTWLEGQAETDEQREFIELRREYGRLNAALTKNLEFFVGVCAEHGGWFNATFNQTVAATHRLTSSGRKLWMEMFQKDKSTQFQNMPRMFKRLFTAPEGYKIAECDSAQLEFRVAVFLGDDPQGRQDIADPDFDAHCTSAAVMNNVPYKKFLNQYRSGDSDYKKLRTMAKPDTFKPLYGGERGTPAQEKWYKEFQSRYSGVYSTQEDWLQEVHQDGSLRLPWGMTFKWKTKMNRRGLLLDSTTNRPVRPQVFNYPVQSLATAEIVPIAITALYKRCKAVGLRATFVNTIHDSVIAYVHEDDVEVYQTLCETPQVSLWNRV
jgi:DNA polymerase I-like protein with 3'-5' exonuclease and polymerase domains